MGIENEKVFPLPVFAAPIILFPYKINGIDFI